MCICQKCGTNIITRNQFGSNYDNSINRDFCSDCYKNGSFVSNVNNHSDAALFAGAFAIGHIASDYYGNIGVPPATVPYFMDVMDNDWSNDL